MATTNVVVLLFGIISLFVHSSMQQSKPLLPHQLRYKISKLQCEPVKGYGNQVKPCYDLSTRKLVHVSKCEDKKYSHCCLHKCACILKGAGPKKVIIPKKYELSRYRQNLAKRKANSPFFKLKNCDASATPATTTTKKPVTTQKTATKRPGNRRQVTTKKPATTRRPITRKRPTPTRKPGVRRPATTKKPRRKPVTKKPTPTRKPGVRRPATTKKPRRKPVTKRPTPRTPKPTKKRWVKPTPRRPRWKPRTTRRPVTTKKPRRTKKPKTTSNPCVVTTKKPSFSFSFFSAFARALNNVGFSASVVRKGPC